MFKPGDEIIAIRNSEYNHYKIGDIFIYEKEYEPAIDAIDHAVMFDRHGSKQSYIIANFRLKKEQEFNSDMKDLLK